MVGSGKFSKSIIIAFNKKNFVVLIRIIPHKENAWNPSIPCVIKNNKPSHDLKRKAIFNGISACLPIRLCSYCHCKKQPFLKNILEKMFSTHLCFKEHSSADNLPIICRLKSQNSLQKFCRWIPWIHRNQLQTQPAGICRVFFHLASGRFLPFRRQS